MMRAEDAGEAIWCPVTQKISSWERNGWTLDQVYTTSYTSAGQPAVDLITEGKSVIRETNTYDVNGMLSKKLSEVSENPVSGLMVPQRCQQQTAGTHL